MFTGIIESTGTIKGVLKDRSNLHFTFVSPVSHELKVDQSVAHNGICLTVTAIRGNEYSVTAIDETIVKTTIGFWQAGDVVNLERAMKLGERLDGHIVQGHVDQVGTCSGIRDASGSRYFTFEYDRSIGNVTIEKGSIAIDGVSLTVVDSADGSFSVAIIPYTLEHTGFKNLKVGTKVNLEFDVIGKYVARLVRASQ